MKRVCCLCKIEKDIEEFYFYNKSQNIRVYRCISCFKRLWKESQIPKPQIPDLDGEIWKDVVGYESIYLVSNLGRIKNTHQKLIASRERRRYLAVTLHKNDKLVAFSIHRLVAIAFIPNPKNRYVVNHINGVNFDNRAQNLEWVSARENTSHALDKTKTSSKFTGVSLRKDTNKWRSYIKPHGKIIHLGQYLTEQEARDAYQNAVKEYNLINKYIAS